MSSLVNPVRAPQLELHPLGQDIQISYGDKTRINSTEDPRVIILFGWMDAPIRLLSKYAMNHRLRWPSSDIVMVQSHPAFIWASEEKREDTMRPLANYLTSTIYRQSRDVTGGILLHVLSNGGGFQLMTLSKVLRSIISSESSEINRGNTIRLATIVDSAPGTGEYSSMLATLTTGVNSPAVKAVLTVPVSIFYLVLRARSIAVGQGNLFTRLHTGLQSEELLPLTDSRAPRVYIYSTADSMVPATSVEKHISMLKTLNPSIDIEVHKFTGSEHVLHERQDPVRYWSAVQAVWERSRPLRAKL